MIPERWVLQNVHSEVKMNKREIYTHPFYEDAVLIIPMMEGCGDIAHDMSKYGNDGKIYGNPKWSRSIRGNCLDFDGINDYVDFGNSAIFNLLDSLSIIAGIAISSTPFAEEYVYHGEAKYGIYFRVDSRLYFFFYPGAPHANQEAGSINALPIDQSFDVAGTWKTGDKVRLYIDGVIENDADTIFTAINNAIVSYSAGRRGHLDMQYFDGVISKISVYNRALSEEEIEISYCSLNPQQTFIQQAAVYDHIKTDGRGKEMGGMAMMGCL